MLLLVAAKTLQQMDSRDKQVYFCSELHQNE